MNKKNIDLHTQKHWKNLFEDSTFSSLIDAPIKFVTKEIEKNKTICPPIMKSLTHSDTALFQKQK